MRKKNFKAKLIKSIIAQILIIALICQCFGVVSAEDLEAEPASEENRISAEAEGKDRVLKAGFISSDGKRFLIAVEYGDDAGIPEGTVLNVLQRLPEPSAEELKEEPERPFAFESFSEPEEFRSDLSEAVKTLDPDGKLLQLGQQDLLISMITEDGQEVQPSAPVCVYVMTD